MADLVLDLVAQGHAALAAGDWEAARRAYQAALLDADTPAARDGLGRALWWVEGPTAAAAERTRAYSGYRKLGDELSAAHVAVWLAHEYSIAFGSPAVAGGWLTRAAGLL